VDDDGAAVAHPFCQCHQSVRPRRGFDSLRAGDAIRRDISAVLWESFLALLALRVQHVALVFVCIVLKVRKRNVSDLESITEARNTYWHSHRAAPPQTRRVWVLVCLS